jgi:hypothetical protein
MTETLIIQESYPVAGYPNLKLALNRRELIQRKRKKIKNTTNYNGKRININSIDLDIKFNNVNREWRLTGRVKITYSNYGR